MNIILRIYTNVSIIVFPGEFQQKDGEITCKNRTNNTIKEFAFPNDFLLVETEAREICQNYCSTNLGCWGCSLICNDGSTICQSGKWNAISECTSSERGRVDGKHLTSLKPSKNIKYILSISRLIYKKL